MRPTTTHNVNVVRRPPSLTWRPAATYDLYMRVQVATPVGPETGEDVDSVFLGEGFGTKRLNTDNDWTKVNKLDDT